MKYTVSHNCGHDQVYNLYGPHADRDKRLAWLATKECTDCYKARKSDAAAAQAEAMALPALTGSDKQIAWAMSLRYQWIDAAMARYDRTIYDRPKDIVLAANICDAMGIAVRKLESRFWIDTRSQRDPFGNKISKTPEYDTVRHVAVVDEETNAADDYQITAAHTDKGTARMAVADIECGILHITIRVCTGYDTGDQTSVPGILTIGVDTDPYVGYYMSWASAQNTYPQPDLPDIDCLPLDLRDIIQHGKVLDLPADDIDVAIVSQLTSVIHMLPALAVIAAK